MGEVFIFYHVRMLHIWKEFDPYILEKRLKEIMPDLLLCGWTNLHIFTLSGLVGDRYLGKNQKPHNNVHAMKSIYIFLVQQGLPNYGDVSSRLALRRSLNCSSFDWYLKNVIPSMFNPKSALAYGEVLFYVILVTYVNRYVKQARARN